MQKVLFILQEENLRYQSELPGSFNPDNRVNWIRMLDVIHHSSSPYINPTKTKKRYFYSMKFALRYIVKDFIRLIFSIKPDSPLSNGEINAVLVFLLFLIFVFASLA